MTERFFSTYQIAKLLGTTLDAVNKWMDDGTLNCTRMPDGSPRITESALIDFLTEQGIDLGEVLSKAGYSKVSDDETGEDTPETPAAEQPQPRPAEPETQPEADAEPEPEPEASSEESTDQPELRAAQICDAVFADAIAQGAQTVRIAVRRGRLLLQLRIAGALRDKPNFDVNLTDAMRREIAAHLLEIADPNTSIETLATPLCSEFTRTVDSRQTSMRISSIPTRQGPSFVIHMPPKPANLDALELDDEAKAELEAMLQSDGLIVVASKRRTGRDAAMQAMFAAADANAAEVLAIGPRFQGNADTISHLPTDPAAGLTYSAAADAIEHQDPDTVILTELRDPKTAWAAFEAAHDGALVIAGTNAFSADGAIAELRAMGIEPWPLGRTLQAVVEQAAVPMLCEHCKRKIADSTCEPIGCDRCGGTGWTGKAILTGVVFVRDRLAELIRTAAPDKQILSEIADSQPASLARAAQAAVDRGATTADKVARIMTRRPA